MKSTFEIILKEDVQKIFNEFSECFNIRIGFFSPTGKEILVSLKKTCSQFCQLVREKLNYRDKCLRWDTEKRKKALTDKHMITYTCYAGMIESIIPIYFKNVHLGFIMLGQYRRNEKKRRPGHPPFPWNRGS